jgi:hypothetical protein
MSARYESDFSSWVRPLIAYLLVSCSSSLRVRLGLQVCLLWALVRGSQNYARCSRRDKEQTLRPTPDKRKQQPFCFHLTLCLPPLFVIGMVVQSVNFGIRIWSLGMIKNVSGDSANDFGTTLCRAAVCLGATPHFNRVVRGLEMMASLVSNYDPHCRFASG